MHVALHMGVVCHGIMECCINFSPRRRVVSVISHQSRAPRFLLLSSRWSVHACWCTPWPLSSPLHPSPPTLLRRQPPVDDEWDRRGFVRTGASQPNSRPPGVGAATERRLLPATVHQTTLVPHSDISAQLLPQPQTRLHPSHTLFRPPRANGRVYAP